MKIKTFGSAKYRSDMDIIQVLIKNLNLGKLILKLDLLEKMYTS